MRYKYKVIEKTSLDEFEDALNIYGKWELVEIKISATKFEDYHQHWMEILYWAVLRIDERMVNR